MDSDTLKMIVGLISRHGLTTVAGYLIGLGLLHGGSDESSFITVGSGIVAGAVAIVWSWWQKQGQKEVAAALKHLTITATSKAAVVTANALPQGAALPK